ncbi:hypothetical protein BC829DRAFT_494112 [Chytridium lagenaria]|nr:hypothetical protein BC829DRAFT_494112 [Chytridium lagenaria]
MSESLSYLRISCSDQQILEQYRHILCIFEQPLNKRTPRRTTQLLGFELAPLHLSPQLQELSSPSSSSRRPLQASSFSDPAIMSSRKEEIEAFKKWSNSCALMPCLSGNVASYALTCCPFRVPTILPPTPLPSLLLSLYQTLLYGSRILLVHSLPG